FSSRRRHTRFSRDWSSDVCSSDLGHHRPREGSPSHFVHTGYEADPVRPKTALPPSRLRVTHFAEQPTHAAVPPRVSCTPALPPPDRKSVAEGNSVRLVCLTT